MEHGHRYTHSFAMGELVNRCVSHGPLTGIPHGWHGEQGEYARCTHIYHQMTDEHVAYLFYLKRCSGEPRRIVTTKFETALGRVPDLRFCRIHENKHDAAHATWLRVIVPRCTGIFNPDQCFHNFKRHLEDTFQTRDQATDPDRIHCNPFEYVRLPHTDA